ncbi:HDOD domain-containing protein [bacterium]|nr:HDOD domain-containing protein [bacterium]
MTGPLTTNNRWFNRNTLVRLLQSETELPALPEIILRLDSLLMSEEAEMSEVVSLLETEPVIVGRVLCLANSALYSSGRQSVNNIQRAVQRLGFKTVRNLLFAAKLPDMFVELPPDIHLRFWEHSLTVGLLTRNLVVMKGTGDENLPDAGFLAGFMHDIGLLVYVQLIPEEFMILLGQGDKSDRSHHQLEVEHFGLDHAELGAMYLEHHWKLSSEVVKAVRRHHITPVQDNSFTTIQNAVYVANLICNLYKFKNGFTSTPEQDNLGLLATLVELGYDHEKVEMLLGMARDSVAATRGMLTN